MYNVNLVLTAELAADYFSLRELDAETQVVQESVAIQQKGLQLVENRHNGGVASGLDLAQQQTLLRLDRSAALPGAAAARAVRTRHRGADRQSGFDLHCPGAAAERQRRCQFHSECRRTCWSDVPISPPPSARWRSRTRWSELPRRRFIRS